MSEFSDKLLKSLGEFADCKHERLKCEQCGAVANIFGWQGYTNYKKLRAELASARARIAELEGNASAETKAAGGSE